MITEFQGRTNNNLITMTIANTNTTTNTNHALVTDPFLLSIISTSACALTQALALADLTASNLGSTAPASQPHALHVSSAQKTLYARLTNLRSLNRSLAHTLRNTKLLTSTLRTEIDHLHLSLQNLYYEQRHLAGEISACESYPHRYSLLPLIPLEEFYERFGGEEQWRQGTEKELMRARIAFEEEERRVLEERSGLLVRRKRELVAENLNRKEALRRLDGDLEAFIDVSGCLVDPPITDEVTVARRRN